MGQIVTGLVSFVGRNVQSSLGAEIHKYYEECDWSKKWAEGLEKILT